MFFTNFFLIYVFFLWFFFLKNNFYSIRIRPSSTDIISNSKVLKKINYNFVFIWNICLFFYLIFYFFFTKIDFNAIWFFHLKINNFYLNLIIFIFFVFCFLFVCICFYKNKNVNFNLDYFISIFNIIVFISLLFLSCNLYSFIFLLEVISVLILYKFAVSNYWFKEKKNLNNYVKNYLNVFFFQYWANFFSSVLIFFSIFNIHCFIGSIDFNFINFILKINLNFLYLNSNLFYSILSIFMLGFFLKIGFNPSHLFKLEIYKGLPFFSVFFYTTFYFFSFFLIFIIIFFVYLSAFNYIIYNIILIFSIFGGLYVLFLLFDVNTTKIFFAYSTIINVLNFVFLSNTIF